MHWRHTYFTASGKHVTTERKYCQYTAHQHEEKFFEDYFTTEKHTTMLETVGFCVKDISYALINRCTDKYVFHYILDGKGFVNGIPFKKGDIIYCKKMTPYSISANEECPCTYAYISFKGGKSDSYIDLLGINEAFKIYRTYKMDKIARIFYELLECPLDDVEPDIFMESALLHILSYSKPMEAEADTKKNKTYSTRIFNAISYISEHYMDADLHVEKISELLHTNTQYLRNQFKAEVGIPIYQYITNLRMDTAAMLLVSSQYNVNEIAEYVGYNDRRNFNEVFKKKFGVTPARFKESNLK